MAGKACLGAESSGMDRQSRIGGAGLAGFGGARTGTARQARRVEFGQGGLGAAGGVRYGLGGPVRQAWRCELWLGMVGSGWAG